MLKFLYPKEYLPSVFQLTGEKLKALGKDVIKFAEAEGLTAHANSIKVRM